MLQGAEINVPQIETVSTITYCLSICFAKLSILALYLRLTIDKNFRTFIWVLVWLICAYVVIYIIVSIFGCSPVIASWDIYIKILPTTTCINKLIPYMVLSVANIVMDFIILFLPIPLVKSLQVPRRQKLSIYALLATGALYV
jgi:hypothetical protein